MGKKKNEIIIQGASEINETILFENVSAIIENRIRRAYVQVNDKKLPDFFLLAYCVVP